MTKLLLKVMKWQWISEKSGGPNMKMTCCFKLLERTLSTKQCPLEAVYQSWLRKWSTVVLLRKFALKCIITSAENGRYEHFAQFWWWRLFNFLLCYFFHLFIICPEQSALYCPSPTVQTNSWKRYEAQLASGCGEFKKYKTGLNTHCLFYGMNWWSESHSVSAINCSYHVVIPF
jgi:hypothetical protein